MTPENMDVEANAFAMELLMPEDWLRADIAKMGGVDIEDEKKVAALAKKYRVSVPAMVLRIGELAGLSQGACRCGDPNCTETRVDRA